MSEVKVDDVWEDEHRLGTVMEVSNGYARMVWQYKSSTTRVGTMSVTRLVKRHRRIPGPGEPDWRTLAQRLATELERQHGMSHDVDYALLAECRAVGLDVRGEE